MGKKSKILYYSCLFVNVICFALDFLPIDFEFFRISFPITLVVIGIWLIVRAFSLKIDSSLFIGIAFSLCGIINFVLFFLDKFSKLKVYNLAWPYYLFALAIASLITAIYFKDRLQAKLFVLFIGLGAILLLFVQNILNLWWTIGLCIAWFVLYFAINILIYKRRNK